MREQAIQIPTEVQLEVLNEQFQQVDWTERVPMLDLISPASQRAILVSGKDSSVFSVVAMLLLSSEDQRCKVIHVRNGQERQGTLQNLEVTDDILSLYGHELLHEDTELTPEMLAQIFPGWDKDEESELYKYVTKVVMRLDKQRAVDRARQKHGIEVFVDGRDEQERGLKLPVMSYQALAGLWEVSIYKDLPKSKRLAILRELGIVTSRDHKDLTKGSEGEDWCGVLLGERSESLPNYDFGTFSNGQIDI